MANIYQTEYGKEPAFVITVGDSVDKFCANLEQNQMAKRLSALEQRLASLEKLFYKSQATLSQKTKKKRPSRDLNPSRSLDRAP